MRAAVCCKKSYRDGVVSWFENNLEFWCLGFLHGEHVQ